MKTLFFRLFFMTLVCVMTFQQSHAQITTISPSSGSWSVPTNVTQFKVELWGGGGGGGNSSGSLKAPAGGGGGAYGRKSFTVTPNKTTPEVAGINLTVGTGGSSNSNGGASVFSFNGSSSLTANGGLAPSGVTPGSAAAAVASGTTFDKTSTGGQGGNGVNEDRGGAGGGGAGADGGNGANGISVNTGQAGSLGGNNGDGAVSGGQGGDQINTGSNIASGRNGVSTGGGGGGAGGKGTSFPGGAGANGQIRISYLQIDYFFYGGSVDRLNPILAAGASGTALDGRNINITGQSASYFDSSINGNITRFFAFEVRPGTAGFLPAPSVTTVGGTIIASSFKSVSNNNSRFQVIIPASQLPAGVSQLLVSFTVSGMNNVRTLEIDQSALPVSFKSFTAKPTIDNKVALAWVTSSESVNKGFSIERQNEADGKFNSLGFIPSKAVGGNSQTMLAYNFKDMTAKNGANMYRLVQEDLDGKLTYSEVRVVKLNGQSVSMVFPNPSNGAITISRTADGKMMNIQVLDQSGRVISQVNNITDANYRMNLPQSGIYSIKMMYPETGEQSIQRVVVQK